MKNTVDTIEKNKIISISYNEIFFLIKWQEHYTIFAKSFKQKIIEPGLTLFDLKEQARTINGRSE